MRWFTIGAYFALVLLLATVVATAGVVMAAQNLTTQNTKRLQDAPPAQTLAMALLSNKYAAIPGAAPRTQSRLQQEARLVQDVQHTAASTGHVVLDTPPLPLHETPYPILYVHVRSAAEGAALTQGLVTRKDYRPIRGGADLVAPWDPNALVRVRTAPPATLDTPLSQQGRRALGALNALSGPGHYVMVKTETLT